MLSFYRIGSRTTFYDGSVVKRIYAEDKSTRMKLSNLRSTFIIATAETAGFKLKSYYCVLNFVFYHRAILSWGQKTTRENLYSHLILKEPVNYIIIILNMPNAVNYVSHIKN